MATTRPPTTTKKSTGKQAKKARTKRSAESVVTAQDRTRVTQSVLAAAYAASPDVTGITPHFGSFGEHVPYEINTRTVRDQHGRVIVTHDCDVDGRKFTIKG